MEICQNVFYAGVLRLELGLVFAMSNTFNDNYKINQHNYIVNYKLVVVKVVVSKNNIFIKTCNS